MADTPVTPDTPKIPIPQPLETPPRSTGNAQSDLPLLLNWLTRAYQVITQSVAYINQQVNEPDFNPVDLPDPQNTTLAQAQDTANQSYTLASQAKDIADEAKTTADSAQDDATQALADAAAAQITANTAATNAASALAAAASALAAAIAAQNSANQALAIFSRFEKGSFVVGAASTGGVVTISAQPDTAYTVNLQALTSTGTPPIDAFVVTSKSYTTGNFTFTVGAVPGVGNSVTYEWQLIRKT